MTKATAPSNTNEQHQQNFRENEKKDEIGIIMRKIGGMKQSQW